MSSLSQRSDAAAAALHRLGPETLELRPSGALWWPAARTLVVADLHLGRSERMARREGVLLPPYETSETLARLGAEITALDPARIVCLGDSFDDMAAAAAAALDTGIRARIDALGSGRAWLWIAGNHDPLPPGLPGTAAPELRESGLSFRHIARPLAPAEAEISGHHHPKARVRHLGRCIARPCFVGDARRLILPAFGCYTGGLDAADPAFDRLVGADARLWLTGPRIAVLPRRAVA